MNKLVVITGANASGKSSLGIKLAKKYDAEIVSADSRQVFKGLDLGSGKVTKEEMDGVPHYLLDVAEPNDFFSVVNFQKLAYEAIDDIIARGKMPILVGGTGLYVNAVVDGYNIRNEKPNFELRRQVAEKSLPELLAILEEKHPKALEQVDVQNKRRVERAVEKVLSGHTEERVNTPRYESLVMGVRWPRAVLYERIRERLDIRLEQGMIKEVEDLRTAGATDEFLYGLGLEYRYILMYLRGEFVDFDAFYNKLFMEIRHLAKEQMTWFRKRKDLHWIEMQEEPYEKMCTLIEKFWS